MIYFYVFLFTVIITFVSHYRLPIQALLRSEHYPRFGSAHPLLSLINEPSDVSNVQKSFSVDTKKAADAGGKEAI